MGRLGAAVHPEEARTVSAATTGALREPAVGRSIRRNQVLRTDTGSARTSEQTAIARFWTANVIRQYNRLARDMVSTRALGVLDSARLVAMMNVIAADAQMSVMNSKYQFLLWRPVTAIDPTAVTADGFGPVPGFDDGNEWTVEETGWRPLIGTPNHPEYPAAHGTLLQQWRKS